MLKMLHASFVLKYDMTLFFSKDFDDVLGCVGVCVWGGVCVSGIDIMGPFDTEQNVKNGRR